MTTPLLGLTESRLASDLRVLAWRSIRVAGVVCVVVCLVGCGGDASTTNSTTSNEDIAAFIEENPEYGNSTPAAGKPSKSTKPKPMGLER
jgi:hypothetical protein